MGKSKWFLLDAAPLTVGVGITVNQLFKITIDLCFIQEHWLSCDYLNIVRDISPDFLSVGVSGMSCDSLCRGRPYGGCSILYRKSLSSCVTPLDTHSDRFCGIKLCDLTGLS